MNKIALHPPSGATAERGKLMKQTNRMDTRTLTMGAILTALVVILQFLALGIKAVLPILPFTVSLVLIPIVIGAARGGPFMGAWLGLVFGVIVLASGDAAAFLAINPFGTVLTVLVKGMGCGIASGLIYHFLSKKNKTVAVYAAAGVCPLVNTGLFFVGCLLFFMDTVSEWAAAFGFGDNVAGYMFVGLAGFNFIFEFVINLALSPVIIRALNLRGASDTFKWVAKAESAVADQAESASEKPAEASVEDASAEEASAQAKEEASPQAEDTEKPE